MSPGRAHGRFITFEGIEGSGKSTQLAHLAARLARGGHPAVVTREPGGTELGQRLRTLLLDPAGPPLSPSAELLLYAADRAQHVEQVVRPALERGALVLCDRYLDATLAYQGYGRGLGAEQILELHRVPPLDLLPDRTVLFDLDPTDALDRVHERDAARGGGGADRFEREDLAFHRRVREGYLDLARADGGRRIRTVDSSGSVEEVARRVLAVLADMLPSLGD